MNNTQLILSTIQSHSDELRSFGISRLGIFGSQARGTASQSSDLDILIDFDSGKKTYRNFIGTVIFLEKILNCSVDPITSSSISPYLKASIEKDIQYVQI